MKRILARREAVVQEICRIELQLLPDEQYELKSERSLRSAKKQTRKRNVRAKSGCD